MPELLWKGDSGGKRSKSERRLSMLFYLLTAYVLLQFSWWAYLLIDLNKKHYATEGADAVRLKILMVAGEGSVFLVFLLTGIFIMQRTISKDIALVRQQRNFLLSITHELKTPLAAIKLCLQTLEKRSELDAKQRIPLQRSAIENTERLHNLIDNVLLATRIESGQQSIRKETIDISTLTHDLCNGLLREIAGGVQIVKHIDEGIQLNVDPNAFESILVNLAENAVKYAGNAPVSISLQNTERGVELRVSDQGPGIPNDEKALIFQKFYRMGNEETRSKKGTGLGLFIVQHLANLHAAKLLVSDNIPHGTTFTVLFTK